MRGNWLDLSVEFLYNGANTLVGYMTAKQVLEMPTEAAWLVAGLMGIIGLANHVRALRKPV
jgi:hypothetical protein